ncbi:MAG: hypothetical protein K6T66_03300 [Peptococcaceae bacterium]|nr:hypothetical protein [Peptococcaceae bacterium]
MITMIETPDYNYLYALTRAATPLDGDCGLLCGSVCCRPDRKNSLGVYLFPGEEALFNGDGDWYTREYHDPAEHGFPGNWSDPVHFIKCHAPCPREARPLACRFFPLAPHLLTDGTLLLIHETARLPYRCPLIEKKVPLRGDFTNTVALAWQILLKDPRIRRLVEEDSREREKMLRGIPRILWSSAI